MKRWLKVLAVAFVAFELWRLAVVGTALVPFWNNRLSPELASLANYPPGVASVAIAVAIIAFVVPMAGVIIALRFVHRRLSRFRTAR